jgi:hopanoid biosynthesis associated RND transporter like protein HpnN
LFFTLFLGSIYVAGTRLGINTDLSDMISDRLDFHKRWKEYRAEFPYLNETFLVVVDGETRRESSELVRQLRQELEKYPDLFLRVFELNGGEFFETYGVLFEEKASLEKLREHAPLAQRLSIKPDPAGFLSLMSHIPLERETKSLWESFSGSLAAAARNELLEMSFLERGDDSRLFLEIYPRLEYDQILPVERAFLKMREIFKEIDPNAKRLKLTGVAALAYEELQSVSEGAVFAGLLSLFLVAIILFWCLRSGRIIFICLSGLLVGLAITAAFAALAIGHLNLISVAFAVLFIGLGIDYSIHLSLRFLQLRENYVPEQAVSLALRDLWKSLLVCTLTTSVGFLAFVPTAYAGVSELGLISGFGMLVNFLIHISFFPAMLLKFGPRNPALIEMQRSFGALLADFCRRRSSLVRGVAGFLILLAIPFAWRVDFDPSPLNLQNPTTEAFRVYQGLLSEANRSPWTIKILVENREQGRDLVQKMSASEAVAEVVWLETFVPRQQKEKREILSSFKTRKPSKSKEASVLDWRTALVSLGETLKEQNLTQESLIELRSEILKTIDKMVAEASFGDRRLSTQLVKNFVEPVLLEWELMAQISDLPDLETDQLPPEIADRYRSPNGLYRVEVFPAKPMTDISAMREFASEILSITPKATDDPVTLPASGDAVVQAFWQASLTAFVLIFMLIFIIFRDLRAAFMVLFPLAFSGLIIKSAMTFLGLSFNFANIIVLPLLLGIGVDSGIHLLHRLRSSAPQEALLGNTARGVFFSALTTIASFGTLSISDHRGTASMGLLLTIGTLVVMLSTLSLIPALVRKQKVS